MHISVTRFLLAQNVPDSMWTGSENATSVLQILGVLIAGDGHSQALLSANASRHSAAVLDSTIRLDTKQELLSQPSAWASCLEGCLFSRPLWAAMQEQDSASITAGAAAASNVSDGSHLVAAILESALKGFKVWGNGLS